MGYEINMHPAKICISSLNRILFLLLLVVILLLTSFTSSRAAVWQWSIAVNGRIDHNKSSRAFLWIPPDCQKIRAVVLAQNNMEEESILENPVFRRAMSDLGFAEVWVSPSFDHLFRFSEGAGDIFNEMMNSLANQSGYKELKYAPIVAMGHSAAASWPYYFAAWNPGRTLAAISVSGQWPYFRSPVFAPDIWGKDQNIDHIPSLETMGEYEAAERWATEGLKERKDHPHMPLSMLACPAEGHFATTDRKVEYLALYIKKAAEYRLPGRIPVDGPPKLNPIDPTKTGWLVPRWRRNEKSTVPAAAVGKYTGDPSQAFWFFDEEMAKATIAYESAYRNKKPQLLGYVQNGKVVPELETHQQVNLKFEPGEDGITFNLKATFMKKVPGGSHFPSVWAQLPKGSPIGHADEGVPVKISRICGPFRKINPHTFQIFFKRGMRERGNSYELWFIATQPGNEEFKPTLLQAEMVIPARNTEGREQHITFPAISNQKIGTSVLRLHASSDSGLPVHFFVRQGPVKLVGNTLVFTKTPNRTRYPVKVTVVAWQYGRSAEPKIQSAKSVQHSFLIYDNKGTTK